MGCDIHIATEMRHNGRWRRVRLDQEYDGRNYRLFAMLADVRNSYGIAPIAEPRGLPDDISHDLEDGENFWLGDHSYSWLTLRELGSYHWLRPLRLSGTIPLPKFVERINHEVDDRPSEYSSGVSGPNVVTFSRDEALTKIHNGGIVLPSSALPYVREEWEETHAEAAGTFYSETLPALRSLADRSGVTADDVRIVFGFDS